MDIDGSNREDMDRRRWNAQWSPGVKYLAWGQSRNIIVMHFEILKNYSDTSRSPVKRVQLHLPEPRMGS